MLDKFRTLWRGQRETLGKEQLERLKQLRRAVWIHAASVGEFEQARTIIEKLRSQQPRAKSQQPIKVVVTFFSPSGYEARKNYELVDGVFYLPFATRRHAKQFLDALQPKMALFVKYEFWPAYLKELHKRNIPTYSISAIFRPTQRFFHWYGKAALRLLKNFTHLYVQDEASRELLVSHGIKQCSVAGDTRFDRVKQVQSNNVQGTKDLTPVSEFVEGAEHVLVAGSTWPMDEQLLARYIEEHGDSKLILVPHEIDEHHLHSIFNQFEGRFVRYSVLSQLNIVQRHNAMRHASVLLIDTIGLLSSIYRFGQVAYIGGGFGVGIHNTIEAAVYGVPVLFGPNYRHFREAKGLIEAGAARSIASYPELESALDTAFTQHAEIGAKAAAYVESELGATDKIYREIFDNGQRTVHFVH
jgi:3-deoxy-D-manno-octulosonic-acid transferase